MKVPSPPPATPFWRVLRAALGLLWVMILAACSGGGGTLQLPDGRVWWPPEEPRQPQRLTLSQPGINDPLEWWSANILSQTPVDAYFEPWQEEFSSQMISEANATRAAYGLPALKPLPLLNRVAEAAAYDQAVRDYWSHKTPEGLSSRDRVKAAGGGTVIVGGENSSINTAGGIDPAGVIYSWEHHTGHRELLLNPDVKYAGAGTYNYSRSEFQYYIMLLVDLAPTAQ